ncbi:hypothetical protein ACWKWZ_04250 [Metapseudomonas otitidis]|uniref:hypothetical protein n=1 Tax=Pseudomonas sp. zfem003 TaxID=3078198 RepID=UPI0029280796|nr:hypothetical protein [Pseudomonas sp. zfem003]MDU9395142.1 hypothetical protein [Pseudomonas sp. zfem003]
MHQPSKVQRFRLLFLMGGLLVVPVMIASAFVGYRIVQNDSGLCIAQNRVLGPEEHRQAFLRSLIRLDAINSQRHDDLFRSQENRTGIIHNPPALDLKALMERMQGNEKTFEENFAIEPVAPRRPQFNAASVREPFVLVSYRAAADGTATFTDSRLISVREKADVVQEFGRPSLYERFRGFGNTYYSMTYSFVDIACCDSTPYGRSRAEVLAGNRAAYLETLATMARGIATHTRTATVSNCGELLTQDSDNGVGTQTIKWTGL